MAHDGWDDQTRANVARGIMANNYFEEIPNKPRHCPGCNHWGAHTGGVGMALLALRGDPGLDTAKIEDLLAKVINNARREIAEGYGSRGYYYEGHHCGRLSSNTGLIPFIQACRVAANDAPWVVMTLQKGAAPAVKADGNKLVVGGRTLTFDGEKIVMAR